MTILFALFERFGLRLGGVVLIGLGMIEVLPYFGISEPLVHGSVYMAFGIIAIAVGANLKKAKDMFVGSEAEKRIVSSSLPSFSSVPPIQAEIEKRLDA